MSFILPFSIVSPGGIVVLEISGQLPLGLFRVLPLIAACSSGWPVTCGTRYLCWWLHPEPAGSLKRVRKPQQQPSLPWPPSLKLVFYWFPGPKAQYHSFSESLQYRRVGSICLPLPLWVSQFLPFYHFPQLMSNSLDT